jgi:hypothetical protein
MGFLLNKSPLFQFIRLPSTKQGDKMNTKTSQTNESNYYQVSQLEIFSILDKLISADKYRLFINSAVFMMNSAFHETKIEGSFSDFARLNNGSDDFECFDDIRDSELDLHVIYQVKSILEILGEEGILKYSLYRLSLDAGSLLPAFDDY